MVYETVGGFDTILLTGSEVNLAVAAAKRVGSNMVRCQYHQQTSLTRRR